MEGKAVNEQEAREPRSIASVARAFVRQIREERRDPEAYFREYARPWVTIRTVLRG